MVELLAITVIESLVCIGVFTAFAKGNLLWPFRKPFEGITKKIELLQNAQRVGSLEAKIELHWHRAIIYIFKPIFLCPMCMASTWGSAVYWIASGECWQLWLISIVGACGLTTVLFKSFMYYHEGLY